MNEADELGVGGSVRSAAFIPLLSVRSFQTPLPNFVQVYPSLRPAAPSRHLFLAVSAWLARRPYSSLSDTNLPTILLAVCLLWCLLWDSDYVGERSQRQRQQFFFTLCPGAETGPGG
jgi:hypothetical protein